MANEQLPTISKIQLPGIGGQPGNVYEIKDAVAREAMAEGLEIRVVDTLPTASKDTKGAIYLVPNSGKGSNVKDEYVTYEPSTGSYAWEKIGTTDIDLSDYAKKGDGVTVTLNHNVSGTGVSAHSVTDNKHSHSLTNGTTTADGTNEASAVSFGSSSVTAVNIKTEGSVTPGSAGTPTIINTSKFNGGTPTAVTLPTFTQADDTFTQGSLPELTTSVANETLTFGWSAGTLPTFTQGEDTWTSGSVTAGSPAEIQSGFYTAGSAGTPTSVTLPTFTAVNNLVDTSNVATAAAQKFTGKASAVTGTISSEATGISIANHTVTDGKVTGSASGTINN